MDIITIVPENIKAFEPILMGSLDPNSMAIGAVEDGYAVGGMTFHQEQSTICIDHIYVPEVHRRKGVGHKLLERLFDRAKEAGEYFFQLQCLEGDEDMIAFFLNEGFSFTKSGEINSIPIESLVTSPAFNKAVNGIDPNLARPLSDFSGGEINKLNNTLIQVMDVPGGFEKGNYDENLSLAVYDVTDKAFKGCLIIDRNYDDIMLQYLANFGTDRSVLPYIFAKLKSIVLHEHMGECMLHYVILDEKMNSVMNLILPDGDDIIEKQNMLTGLKVI
ncbi:MAG: GNAT family N-acetyltransferase [Lachnospiraceae bacterium]|nr:GNAT family N-acetyltransferase [Lachnospiraceae bacterium]